MQQRTAEIIMVCKGQHDFGRFATFKDAIAAYMSDRCACPITAYTDDIINDIILAAAMDLVDQMKKPSVLLWQAQQVMRRHNNPLVQNINRVDIFEALCGAFQLMQVRDDTGYINGFTEENTQFVHKERV